jgi:hypothetical protein
VELGGARWPGSGGSAGELGRCPMKVMTPGSLTGWAHLSARGRRRPNRQAEQATAETDERPNRTSGASDEPTGQTGREEVGHSWAGKK